MLIGLYSIVANQAFSIADFFDNALGGGQTTTMVVVYLPIFLYHPMLEILFNGRTLGKRLLNIRVAKVNGIPANVAEIFLRWLMRPFDMKIGLIIFFLTPFFSGHDSTLMNYYTAIFLIIPMPLVGLISIMASPKGQRLGDRLANTVVIQKGKAFSLSQTILQSEDEAQKEHQVKYKQAINLRDKDIYIIKRLIEVPQERMDHKKVVLIAEKAENVLKIKSKQLPLPFLKQLVLDYQYLAKKKDLEDE